MTMANMFEAMLVRFWIVRPGVAQTSQTRLQAQARPRPAEPARMSKSGLAHAVEKSIWSDEDPEAMR